MTFFVFTALPFGLSSACYAFTKLLRPLVRYWRSLGLRAVIYLDDGIVAVAGYEEAVCQSKKIQVDLAKAGFIVNEHKSQWIPVKRIVWLGFELDLELGQLKVPEGKLETLRGLLAREDNEFIPAKALASLIGKIASMSPALGPVTRLRTRSLYTVLNFRASWCQVLMLSQGARGELVFWRTQIEPLMGKEFGQVPQL